LGSELVICQGKILVMMGEKELITFSFPIT
jgi:hypothetical protein